MWLTDLADVLRAAGLVVRENPSWRTRGYGGRGLEAVAGVVIHHTAEAESADPAVMARYLGIGRSDLAGPLYHTYCDGAGVWWLIAAGWANHGGSGWWPGLEGNADTVGFALANTGRGEPYPDVQLLSATVGVAAICDAYDVDPGNVIGHKEFSPGRKIDPYALSMGVFRASVAEEMRMALSDEDVAKVARAVAELGVGWPVRFQDLDNPAVTRVTSSGMVNAWHAVSHGDKLVNNLGRARIAAEGSATVRIDDAAAAAIAEQVAGHLGDAVARLVADEIFRRMEA